AHRVRLRPVRPGHRTPHAGLPPRREHRCSRPAADHHPAEGKRRLMTAPGKVTPPRAEVNPPAEEKQQLSRRLVRIILGGTGFAAFDDNPSTDKYVKILFVDPQQGLALPCDLSALRAEPPRK